VISTVRFRRLLAASGLSSIGDGMLAVALPLVALRLTGDARIVGGLVAVQHLPWLVAAPLSGAVVDRYDLRRLAVLGDLGRAACVGVLAGAVLAGTGGIALLYVIALVTGVLETVSVGVAHAALPAVVAPADLAAANGRLDATTTAGELFLGPILGAALFTVEPALPIFLDAVSFVASAALLFTAVQRRTAAARDAESNGLARSVVTALRWYRQHPLLPGLTALVGTLAFAQAIVFATLVLYARDEVGISEGRYGVFLAAGAAGTVLGGIVAGRARSRRGTAGVLRAAIAGGALAYGLLALASEPALATLGLAVLGGAVAVGNAVTVAFRQRTVPAAMLGRAGNLFRTFVFGAWPLGALVGGALTERFDARLSMVLAAGIHLAVLAVASVGFLPRLAAAERATIETAVVRPLEDPARAGQGGRR
jgi:MFS family permease